MTEEHFDEAFNFIESLARTRRERDEEEARLEERARKRRLEHPGDTHPEVRTDRAVGFARQVESVMDAMFCNHANEVPSVCPCDADCYCKTRTCKYGSPGAPEPGRLQLGRDAERMETGRARVATPPMQSSAEKSPGRLVPRFVEQTTRVAYTESPQVYPSIDETLKSMGDYALWEALGKLEAAVEKSLQHNCGDPRCCVGLQETLEAVKKARNT